MTMPLYHITIQAFMVGHICMFSQRPSARLHQAGCLAMSHHCLPIHALACAPCHLSINNSQSVCSTPWWCIQLTALLKVKREVASCLHGRLCTCERLKYTLEVHTAHCFVCVERKCKLSRAVHHVLVHRTSLLV